MGFFRYAFLSSKGRVFFAFYLSLVLHTIFLVYFFNSGRDWTNKIMLCGPPWIYQEEEEIVGEVTLSFGSNDSSGGEGNFQEGSEEGEEAEGFPINPNFDKDKYKGSHWEELVEKLEETSELRKNFKNSFDNIFRDGSVSDSYIFRKRDYEDIIVKEVFPTIYDIDKPFEEEIKKAPDELSLHKERNRIIDSFRNKNVDADILEMQLDMEGRERNKVPLSMPREERMKYLDKTLPKRKEDQLSEFISRYMNYNPNEGDLPVFVRDLYYENLQRLAYNFSSDPTYFTIDYFQENLNKEDFLKNSLSLYSEFKNSKVGSEILFTLENIYEIQERALILYFQNMQSLPYLSEESKKQLRVEVIRRVVEKYKKILKEKNIQSIADVHDLYFRKRIEIMDTLLANTPDHYRVKDAIFEKGRIYWEYSQHLPMEKRKEYQIQALQEWKKIESAQSSGDFLNEKTYLELKNLTRGFLEPFDLIPEYLERNINIIIRDRLAQILHEKSIREGKLLWKKTQKN